MWLDSEIHKRDNLTRNYKITIAVSCYIQLACFVAFAEWAVGNLVTFSALAIIFHIGIYFAVVNPKWVNFCLVSLFAECVIFTSLCNYYIGYGYGFSIYAVALIPMCFFNSYLEENIKFPFFSSLLFSVSNLIFTLVSIMISDFDVLNLGHNGIFVKIFFIGNFILGISFMSLYSSRYYHILKANDEAIRKKNEELFKLAHYDKLTGLRNRNEISEEILSIEGDYCAVMGDIDKFKRINDTYGHDCGDRVLATVGRIIRDNIGEDIACRWGGEEFLLSIKGSKEKVTEKIEKLRKQVEDEVIIFNGSKIHVTMTFGVASSLEENDADKLVILADDRTYIGKKAGRNRVISESGEEV